ncbi:hypothetical protein BC939DRAFT_328087 [Gamsiella multidivaricata]|uniref:uncharacterized protein n=1 Tax=Gamsiella multidivaricata TaxID=101098 RepID=UPI00221E3924|nr:uncharacterized protein BC939DRAFT_328087 [Gamsiella multidivaricata]KAG0370358.1 hypothetical protein BGZ54_006715 [Gamsiella multidivaricata]KAI7817545.1 hypothetical protein BC939DRAFT_328087 [Gamsiella multidivaricata]
MIFPKPTSYYEKGFKRSPALERATAPFRVRNALTGAGLVAFCASVYAYSILAVRQDDFSDIQLPQHVLDQQKEYAALAIAREKEVAAAARAAAAEAEAASAASV